MWAEDDFLPLVYAFARCLSSWCDKSRRCSSVLRERGGWARKTPQTFEREQGQGIEGAPTTSCDGKGVA